MTITIGSKRYPDDVWGMMKDRTMGPLFHKFCQTRLAHENTAFLNALAKRTKLPILYNAFIKPDSQFEINIPGNMRKYMVHMGGVSDWDHAGWKKSLEAARVHIVNLLDANFSVDFWKSEVFRKFIFKETGDPKKAAKLLGIRDEKLLGDIIIDMATGKKADAKRKMKTLAQKEKLKDKADALLNVLSRAGFIGR